MLQWCSLLPLYQYQDLWTDIKTFGIVNGGDISGCYPLRPEIVVLVERPFPFWGACLEKESPYHVRNPPNGRGFEPVELNKQKSPSLVLWKVY